MALKAEGFCGVGGRQYLNIANIGGNLYAGATVDVGARIVSQTPCPYCACV